MDNKSLILEEIKGLKVGFITNKDLFMFFNHLNLSKDEIRAGIQELIDGGELISSRNKLFLPERIGFVRGKVVGNKNGFGFLKVVGKDSDYFIAPQNMGDAINGDTVLARVLEDNYRYSNKNDNRSGKTRAEVKVEKVIKHAFERVVGTFQKNGSACFVVPTDSKINRDIFIPGNSSANAKVGQIVNVKITDFGNQGLSLEGEIIEILGYPNDKGVDVLQVAREHDLTEKFPDEVLQEADKLPDEVDASKYPKRQKFFEDVITIDGEDTRDIDDAISLKKEGDCYRLWVHIADVNEYLHYNGALDQEAFTRGTSVYFPNYVIPMFPIKLSNGICSLHEGVDRLTLTCEMLIDANGKALETDIYESIIRSSHRMTYDEVQRICDGDQKEIKKYADVAEMLKNMNELGKILYQMRDARGALDFGINEAYIKVDENGKTVDIEKRPRRDSEKIIESFMIAANEAVAEHFYNLSLPFVYRVHENPDIMKVKRFGKWCEGFGELFQTKDKTTNYQMQKFLKAMQTKDYGSILSKLALRTMEKARYSDENLGHYGIASKCYCHFTSPIRRYPDLSIHRIIKLFLNGEIYNKDMREIEEFVFQSADNSSITERNAEEAEREVDDMKKAEYMQQFIGQEFVGMVSGVTEYGVFVELDNTCEGRIDLDNLAGKWTFDDKQQVVKGPKGTFRLGKKVKVKLLRSCPEEKEIDFDLIDILENSTEQRVQKTEKLKKTSKNHRANVFF